MLARSKEKPRFESDFNELQSEMKEQMALGLPYTTSVLLKYASRKCLKHQSLYYQIEKSTKVWWPVIGWFHYYFLDFRLDTFDSELIGVKPERLERSLANASYPAPYTFEESIGDSLRQAFMMKDWMRNRSFEQILSTVSIVLLKSPKTIYQVSDMMTLGTFQNSIPVSMKNDIKVGFIPFLNYLVDNKLIDTESKDVSLPIGFSNIVDSDRGIKF